jgi:hypothetical protein
MTLPTKRCPTTRSTEPSAPASSKDVRANSAPFACVPGYLTIAEVPVASMLSRQYALASIGPVFHLAEVPTPSMRIALASSRRYDRIVTAKVICGSE